MVYRDDTLCACKGILISSSHSKQTSIFISRVKGWHLLARSDKTPYISGRNLRSSQFSETSNLWHLLNSINVRLINLDATMANDKTSKFSWYDTKCTFKWVHLKLLSLQLIRDCAKIFQMIFLDLDLTTNSLTYNSTFLCMYLGWYFWSFVTTSIKQKETIHFKHILYYGSFCFRLIPLEKKSLTTSISQQPLITWRGYMYFREGKRETWL